jgi:hypothetical protein
MARLALPTIHSGYLQLVGRHVTKSSHAGNLLETTNPVSSSDLAIGEEVAGPFETTRGALPAGTWPLMDEN